MHKAVWCLFLLVPLSLHAVADCPEGGCDRYGSVDDRGLESPHPYPPGAPAGAVVWSATVAQPGATEVGLRFARFELGPEDELWLLDRGGDLLRRYTTDAAPGLLVRVPGDFVELMLFAFGSGPHYGVRIPYAIFREPDLLVAGPPTSVTFRDATCLKPGHPCADAQWYASARATARIFIIRGGGTVAQCTGTLLDRQERHDMLITARHCLVSVSEVIAEFGAEYAPDCTLGTSECLSPQHKLCEGTYYTSRAVHLSPTCDWGLVALEGNPGDAWGTVPLVPAMPPVGTTLYIIEHPSGRCMEWDTGTITGVEAGACAFSYSGAQTAGGSSGSSLRRAADSRIVGVHSGGGGGVQAGAMLPTIDTNVLDTAYAGHPPPGINVAPRAVRVRTSSVYGPQWGGENAVDGVYTYESKWVSADADPPQWLSIDLGETYDVTGFGIVSPSFVGESGGFNPKAFSFQTASSFDGPWRDEFVVGNHLHTERVTYRGFPDITKRIRYVRLHLTEANRLDRIARVVELEVYALATPTGAATLELR